ncbi:MAG: hypothetical protein QW046_01125 [Candidatus Micrarchaeaceae archaeon]
MFGQKRKDLRSIAHKHTARNISIAILVLIIIIIAAYELSLPRVPLINVQRTFNIHVGEGIYFSMPSGHGTYYLLVKNSTASGSIIYITGMPVLSKPVIAAFIPAGGGANMSTDALQSSNIHIFLNSSNSSGVRISLSPISTGLAIKPSPYIVILPAILSEHVIYNGSVGVITTTTSTTTTIAPTTTVSANATIPTANIMKLVGTMNIGTLMNEYSTLYAKDKVCNESIYNATMLKYGITPTGPFSFYNASMNTPYALETNITSLGKGNYEVTYSTLSRSSPSPTPALIIIMNYSSGLPKSVDFVGVYQGLNYTELNAAYQFQSSISNFCGAYIPYMPYTPK